MTIELLEKKLKELGVPEHYYNLAGKGNDDFRVNLAHIGDKWVVYYSERGIRDVLFESASVDDAAEYIYAHYLRMAKRVQEGKSRW